MRGDYVRRGDAIAEFKSSIAFARLSGQSGRGLARADASDCNWACGLIVITAVSLPQIRATSRGERFMAIPKADRRRPKHPKPGATRLAEAHDVLLIPPIRTEKEVTPDNRSKMLRMEIKEDGSYKASTWLDPDAEGARKVYNIARPGPDDEPTRGPGFGVLPIRPEPGSQFNTCFLINTDNLRLPNPWTAAYWDAPDQSGELPPQRHTLWSGSAAIDGFELLVATPQGKVFFVRGGSSQGDADRIDELDMSLEPEIWGQLREGVIVGTVMCVALNRIVPLVNPTALRLEDYVLNQGRPLPRGSPVDRPRGPAGGEASSRPRAPSSSGEERYPAEGSGASKAGGVSPGGQASGGEGGQPGHRETTSAQKRDRSASGDERSLRGPLRGQKSPRRKRKS
jgi:hypothetical protein